ncbi:hypothetical protein DsansV1_C06g0061231 [Dioscorea sansibarensis]
MDGISIYCGASGRQVWLADGKEFNPTPTLVLMPQKRMKTMLKMQSRLAAHQ